MEYCININETKNNQIIIEKKNNIFFNAEYDFDFFKEGQEIKNYNYILIEGIIDTVGEIHHLLYRVWYHQFLHHQLYRLGQY